MPDGFFNLMIAFTLFCRIGFSKIIIDPFNILV